MTDRLYIDGVDVFKAYGIVVGLGGYKHLVQYPALKEVKCVDWPEENGVEPDLLNPVLAAKDNFSILISCQRYPVGFDAFCEFLNREVYHEFYFKEIGVTAIIRFNSITNLKYVGTLATMTMNVSFDGNFLSQFVSYKGENVYLTFNGRQLIFNESLLIFTDFDDGLGANSVVNVRSLGMLLDGDDFALYGAMPLEGAKVALESQPVIKENLKISSAHVQGQQYDSGVVKLDKKDVSIPILIRASCPPLFWEKYLSFLSKLVQPSGRILTYNGKQHKFYYKSQNVEEFAKLPDNSIWCQFKLNICLYEGE